ncbi:HNH endonuclease [Terrabacter sp. GCM10028922]|uniref:HNH endonuclease n=1 Tax=Terrabacter sp. GCM10028922 TaxID=3273428 RepID=UPI00361DF6A7
MTQAASGHVPALVPAAASHRADAVLDVSDLADLYRVRAAQRVPVARHDLSLVERAVRREVAQTVLDHQLPVLVAELVSAATDDLSPAPPTDAETMADAELRVVEAVERCKAVLDGLALEALARLESGIEASDRARFAELGRATPPGWVSAETLTTLEVSTATGLGQQTVQTRLQLATARTPGAADLRARLRRGTVSLHRACTIQAEIAGLPAEVGPSIIASTLRPKDEAPPSPTLFRQRLTRSCLAADRQAVERRRAARRRRGAHARIDPDGMGVLTVVNDADKIVAAMERADAVARAARQAGDPRNLDSLRADVITDTLIFGDPDPAQRADPTDRGAATEPAARVGDVAGHGTPGDFMAGHWTSVDGMAAHRTTLVDEAAPRTTVGRRPPAHVTVIVPLTTAIGLTDAPCEVPGYGWVAAEHARQIMLNDDSTWQRLVVDPQSGAALQLETTAYRPTAAMRAHVEAVDGTCRGPGCTVPAARCDLDHDIPWPQGPTAVGNLTHKHRQHHSLHTHGHWSVHRDADDTVRWRTKAGRTYLTRPKDWLEVVRDSPAPGDPPSHREPPAHTGDETPPF